MNAARRAVVFFFASAFLQALDNQLVQMLLPVLRNESPGADRFLQVYGLGAAIIPFIVAWKAHRRHNRTIIVASLFALGLAALLFAAAPVESARLLARACAGAASGVLSFALLIAAADDPLRRASNVTAANAGFLSAFVAGVPLGAVAAEHVSPNVIFFAVAGAAFVATLFATRMPPLADPAEAPKCQPLARLISDRRAGLALLATILVGAAMAGPTGYLSSFLRDVRHFSLESIGLVYLCSGLAPLLVVPFSSRVIARGAPERVAAFGSILIIVPIVAFPIVAVTIAAAGATMLASIALETVRRSALQTHLSTVVGTDDLARFLGLRGILTQLGLTAGFFLAAYQYASVGFQWVCTTSALISLLAAAALLLSRTPKASTGSACR